MITPPQQPFANKSECRPTEEAGGLHHDAELKPDAIVGGRYRILSAIGRGGMGTVYKCEQIFLGKELALKVLDLRNVSDVSLRRFQQEAKAVFAIEHPNLIAVHDFGLIDDQIPFFTMDYIRGKSLADHIKDRGALSVEEAVPIFLRICFGLAFAHEQGVVHRDIKPSNIMLAEDKSPDDEDCVRIVDFGIAKFTQRQNFDIQTLTKTGEVFGSPLYMSPEQCLGTAVDRRSDIYSVGCVLFECLTGTPPFLGMSALSTMMRHAHETTPSLKEAALGKEFSQSIESIVAKMLAKESGRRYQNLGQVIEDLASLQRGSEPGNICSRVDIPPALTAADAKQITMSVQRFIALVAAVVTITAMASMFFCRQYLNYRTQQGQAAHPLPQGKPAKQIFDSGVVDILNEARRLESKQSINFLAQPVYREELERMLAFRNNDGRIGLKFRAITPEDLRKIGNTSWVKNIDFGRSRISNPGLHHLARLNLYHITVSDTNFNDNGADRLSNCQSLQAVEVGNTEINDPGVESLTRLKKILSLDLEGTRITERSIKTIAHCKPLKWLDLSNVRAVSDESMRPLANCGLFFLSLENTKAGDGAAEIISTMSLLRTVDIGHTNISFAGMEKALRNKTIKTVYYLSCPKISDTEWKLLKVKFSGVNFINGKHAGDSID